MASMQKYLLFFMLFTLMACQPVNSAPTPTAESVQPTSTLIPTPTQSAELTPEAAIDQMERLYRSADFISTAIADDYDVTEWQTGDPADFGMDGDLLAKIPDYVEEKLPQIHSVLVVRDGALVYEFYADGRDQHSADLVWSVTKSFTSVLIGIAADDGLLTLDQTLGDILTAEQLANSDPNLASVTVRDLLTMQSGIFCQNDACHGASTSTVLTYPLKNEPGETFVYDTGASNLLSAVIAQVTGQSLYDYAVANLFDPLDMPPPPWQIDGEGNAFGGKGLAMRPRDMAKFGQLVLNEGMWDKEVVVSAEFIQAATQNQLADQTNAPAYGYLFWLNQSATVPYASAVGYGGQYITIVPDHNLVIVITSRFMPLRQGSDSIIEPFILKAVLDG